jgi:hypothetical protein
MTIDRRSGSHGPGNFLRATDGFPAVLRGAAFFLRDGLF